MDRRETQIVLLVQRKPGISPDELATHAGIRVRALRDLIHRINEQLDGVACITLTRGKGYHLAIDDRKAFDQRIVDNAPKLDEMPATPSDRVRYLLYHLLQSSDWVTLDELASRLFVSRASISTDLKQVEHVLETYSLKLARRPRYGIRVEGDEFNRRLCLATGITSACGELIESALAISTEEASETPADASPSDKPAGSDLIDMLIKLASCIETPLREGNLQLRPITRRNLLVHLSVAIARIRSGCYLPKTTNDFEQIAHTPVYPIAQNIARKVSEEFDVDMPPEETAYIAIHLAGKRVLDSGSAEEEALVVSDEAWEVTARMIDAVSSTYGFDFGSDLELHMNLARHVMPLAVRLRYGMHLDNPLLDDVRARFPLAYAMALDASTVLSEHYGAAVSESEAGYLALAFALAIERSKNGRSKKSILVVCATGAGSARLLEYRCRQEFEGYISHIETCDVAGLDQVDLSRFDYVFTTVPLGRNLPIPVREVSYFLDENEARSVHDLLCQSNAAPAPIEFFSPELFVPHLPCTTKQEALDTLIDHAAAHATLPGDFKEMVWERESAAPTSFGNRVALPHAIRSSGERFLVCVGITDHDIDWGTGPVRAIFLLLVPTHPDNTVMRFFDAFSKLMFDERALGELIEQQRFETLAEIFRTAAHEGGDADER